MITTGFIMRSTGTIYCSPPTVNRSIIKFVIVCKTKRSLILSPTQISNLLSCQLSFKNHYFIYSTIKISSIFKSTYVKISTTSLMPNFCSHSIIILIITPNYRTNITSNPIAYSKCKIIIN